MADSLNQQQLFRNTDPVTSRLAAEQFVGVGKKAIHEQTILSYLRGRKSSKTCQEIAGGTGMEYHAVARRMKELEGRGFVRRAGTSINSGRPMTEWEATKNEQGEAGRATDV